MTTFTKSALQRLIEVSDDFEAWWDSSPLIFKAWAKSMIDKANPQDREELEKQLKVLFDYDSPSDTLFSGVTTNPRLTIKALNLLTDEVNPIIDKMIIDNPVKDNYKLAWKLYKAIT